MLWFTYRVLSTDEWRLWTDGLLVMLELNIEGAILLLWFFLWLRRRSRRRQLVTVDSWRL